MIAQCPVERWSLEQFAACRTAWDALLQASEADPLFMSWDWQWRWWLHHAAPLAGTLELLAVYDGPALVGLAPLYSRSVRVKGLLKSRRLELIGNAWHDRRGWFSEYLDVIARRGSQEQVVRAIATELVRQGDWQELVLCCIRRDSVAARVAQSGLLGRARVREVDTLEAWRTHLPEHFGEYAAALSSGTRRKLLNQRGRIPDARIETAVTAEEVTEYLALLERYSAERWHAQGQREHHRGFERDFALGMAQAGRLRLTRLVTSGRVLSVMCNVRCGSTIYYLRSGFQESQGISPGYLHFGYALESACAEHAACFDFLAGGGRHREYKEDLLTEPVPLTTYHLSRGHLAVLREAYDYLRGGRGRRRN
ncbi:MAG TPA: GNAT family N-acetyltransferase [Steroidobacteraceae bacterium]|nr:GNAT family N-acetyltransferase [Steroidobacteraceae bacterium]